jgi:SAM-dependent methyltransferase
MNTRIFALIKENLDEAFHLEKYDKIRETFSKDTIIDDLPWTPARQRKFTEHIASKLQFDEVDLSGTIEQAVARLDTRYMNRFFGEIWQPDTDKYQFSGWALVDLINKQDPKAVLDFGCGYNPFKGRIPNLVGIDPYNNQADYMVDILEFAVEPETYDHIIVFGSLNFGDRNDIDTRFAKLNELLMPGGRMYFRANPGHLWPKGPYVDIFPWTFEVAYDLAKTFNLELEKFKKDNGNRLYFEFYKPEK